MIMCIYWVYRKKGIGGKCLKGHKKCSFDEAVIGQGMVPCNDYEWDRGEKEKIWDF